MLTAATERLPQSNPGFSRMFAPGKLTLGVLFAIESYPGDAPTMKDQIRLARFAESAGFASPRLITMLVYFSALSKFFSL